MPGGGLTAVGNAVTGWDKAGGSGSIGTLAGTATRVPGGVNTFDYLQFDGASNWLGPASGGQVLPDVQTTIFTVVRVNSFDSEDFRFIYDGHADWEGALTIGLRDYGSGPVPSSGPVFGGNDNYAVPIPIGEWYVCCVRMRRDTFTDMSINGELPWIGDGGGGAPRNITFGAHASHANPGEVDITRHAIYSGILSNGAVAPIFAGLMAQYGIDA